LKQQFLSVEQGIVSHKPNYFVLVLFGQLAGQDSLRNVERSTPFLPKCISKGKSLILFLNFVFEILNVLHACLLLLYQYLYHNYICCSSL